MSTELGDKSTCMPYPCLTILPKYAHFSPHNDPEWKILKVNSDATFHGTVLQQVCRIKFFDPQHYEHTVHQRQLAKLPILGSKQRLCCSTFLSIWTPTEGEPSRTYSFSDQLNVLQIRACTFSLITGNTVVIITGVRRQEITIATLIISSTVLSITEQIKSMMEMSLLIFKHR